VYRPFPGVLELGLQTCTWSVGFSRSRGLACLEGTLVDQGVVLFLKLCASPELHSIVSDSIA
jgi:hypothetical protein